MLDWLWFLAGYAAASVVQLWRDRRPWWRPRPTERSRSWIAHHQFRVGPEGHKLTIQDEVWREWLTQKSRPQTGN